MTECLADRFVHDILDELAEKRLTLPTLPEAAVKIREAVDDEGASLQDIVQAVATDTALSARLIQIANSPMMRAQVIVDSLELAIKRLGLRMTRDISMALLAQQLFRAQSPEVARRLRDAWTHSVMVSAISHTLAKHYTTLDPGQALLAGLTHKIGHLPVLTKAEQYPELLGDHQALDAIVQRTHPEIGAAILEAWRFGPEVIHAVREHENLAYDSPRADYLDVVIVANLQSLIGTEHPLAQSDWSQVPAFGKLGLGPDCNVFEMEETAAEVEGARQALAA